ncbi:hypothetical protein CONLIGDRAFT_676473 [Coniochaeta ligniaria NRRL 30616]|uniref:Uncharacterized protein n=1 Tax=Coniochaeta ligniaria NRRL 30616 TaxID=1408157 RepID=A0A1J7J6Z0_9PEZI|nr:hypothetical protein CONLIGDRAFT_676473 [Coniochaeta ligniaria NRRL 30616]
MALSRPLKLPVTRASAESYRHWTNKDPSMEPEDIKTWLIDHDHWTKQPYVCRPFNDHDVKIAILAKFDHRRQNIIFERWQKEIHLFRKDPSRDYGQRYITDDGQHWFHVLIDLRRPANKPNNNDSLCARFPFLFDDAAAEGRPIYLRLER